MIWNLGAAHAWFHAWRLSGIWDPNTLTEDCSHRWRCTWPLTQWDACGWYTGWVLPTNCPNQMLKQCPLSTAHWMIKVQIYSTCFCFYQLTFNLEAGMFDGFPGKDCFSVLNIARSFIVLISVKSPRHPEGQRQKHDPRRVVWLAAGHALYSFRSVCDEFSD